LSQDFYWTVANFLVLFPCFVFAINNSTGTESWKRWPFNWEYADGRWRKNEARLYL